MWNSEEDYDAYLQEQAFLEAQGQADFEWWIEQQEHWYYSMQDKYHYATVRFFPTGDPLPVYMMVVAVFPSGTIDNYTDTLLECIVIKSYNPQYVNREKLDISASAVEIIEPEITKFNPEVDF